MTCDKVDVQVKVNEDGWEILDILGRHEEFMKRKKSTNNLHYKY